jgi:autotransporter-associated beta strand protein
MTLFPNTTTNPLKNMKTPALSPGYPVIFSRNQTAFLSGCKKSRVLLAACIAFLAFCLCAENGRAATDTWSATASTGSWTTAGNWSDVANAHPSSGDSLIFGASTTTALTDDLMTPATYTIGNITFNSGAPAYTISPNTAGSGFTLGGGGTIANNSSNTQTIGDNINLAGAATLNATSGALTLNGSFGGSIAGSVNFNPTNTITLGGNDTFTFTSQYTGPIFNAGAGGVVITGTTAFNGTASGLNPSGYFTEQGTTTVTVAAGGSLTLNPNNNPNTIVGQGVSGGSTSTLAVNGGLLTVNGGQGFVIGNSNTFSPNAVLTISSGTASIIAGSATIDNQQNYIAMGRDSTTTSGTINLNGGVLATGRQFVRGGDSGSTNVGNATFNFNGGTLRALAAQTSGNGWFETATSGNYQNVTTNVLAGGATVDTNSFNANINTVLAHGGTGTDGGLTKVGAGTLTLGAVNTYNGGTTISSGTLALSSGGSINSSSGITINGAGAKFVQTSSFSSTPAITLTQGGLDGTGTVGAVTVASLAGNTVANGNGASSTALTLGSLTFSGAGTTSLRLAGGATTNSPGLVVTNGLTLSGGAGSILVNITPTTGFLNGDTYELIGYGGSFTGSPTNFTLAPGVLSGRQNGTFADTAASNGFITLAVAGDNPVWSGAASNLLVEYPQNSTLHTGNLALKAGHTATDFWTNDSLEFNDTYNVGAGAVAVTATTVNINSGATNAGGIAPNSITFNNSVVNYSITSSDSAGITSGYVTKNGTAKVIISNSNSYTGATTVSAGTLNIQNSGALGATSGVTVASGGVLELQNGISVGARPLTINGAGLTASPAGALRNVSGVNSYAGLVTLGANATIESDGGSLALTNAGTITGSGFSLTLSGAGNGSIASIIGTGAGGVTVNGSGTWTLSGANTFTGALTVSSGVLSVSAANNFNTASGVTLGGNGTNGTLEDTSTAGLTSNEVFTLATGGTGTFQVDNASETFTIPNTANLVTGSGLLVKTGSGALNMGNSSQNFSGGALIANGALNLANNGGDAGTGSITIGLQGSALNATLGAGNGGITYANPLVVASGAGTRTISAGSGGNETFSGPVTLGDGSGAGTLIAETGYANNNGTSILILSNAVSGTGNIVMESANAYNTGGTTSANVTLSGSQNQTGTISSLDAGGTVSNGVNTISGALGAGISNVTENSSKSTLVLSGNSPAFTGSATVTKGTLIVSGSLSGVTALTVASGATLEVDGFVNNTGAAAINGTLLGTGSMGAFSSTGATIEPGLSTGSTTTGTLTANGNVSLDSASTLSIRVGVSLARSGSDNDVLASTGAVTLNGAHLNLTIGSNLGLAALNTFYTIINGGAGATGSGSNIFAGLTEGHSLTFGGNTFDIFYADNGTGVLGSGNNVDLELVTAVPEPGTWGMLIGGVGMLVAAQRMRRRNT